MNGDDDHDDDADAEPDGIAIFRWTMISAAVWMLSVVVWACAAGVLCHRTGPAVV